MAHLFFFNFIVLWAWLLCSHKLLSWQSMHLGILYSISVKVFFCNLSGSEKDWCFCWPVFCLSADFISCWNFHQKAPSLRMNQAELPETSRHCLFSGSDRPQKGPFTNTGIILLYLRHVRLIDRFRHLTPHRWHLLRARAHPHTVHSHPHQAALPRPPWLSPHNSNSRDKQGMAGQVIRSLNPLKL